MQTTTAVGHAKLYYGAKERPADPEQSLLNTLQSKPSLLSVDILDEDNQASIDDVLEHPQRDSLDSDSQFTAIKEEQYLNVYCRDRLILSISLQHDEIIVYDPVNEEPKATHTVHPSLSSQPIDERPSRSCTVTAKAILEYNEEISPAGLAENMREHIVNNPNEVETSLVEHGEQFELPTSDHEDESPPREITVYSHEHYINIECSNKLIASIAPSENRCAVYAVASRTEHVVPFPSEQVPREVPIKHGTGEQLTAITDFYREHLETNEHPELADHASATISGDNPSKTDYHDNATASGGRDLSTVTLNGYTLPFDDAHTTSDNNTHYFGIHFGGYRVTVEYHQTRNGGYYRLRVVAEEDLR
jgi:hypothetical protein